jgi:hypothetical protein
MIKALQDRFCTSDVDTIADLADEIIDFLESHGMLPPAYEKFVEAPVKYIDETVYLKVEVNEWEPEND